jgi:hypothetical protein
MTTKGTLTYKHYRRRGMLLPSAPPGQTVGVLGHSGWNQPIGGSFRFDARVHERAGRAHDRRRARRWTTSACPPIRPLDLARAVPSRLRRGRGAR